MSIPKIIIILGPTASGKSDLAVKIAKKFNGEIISADSRQVYKELDIGSGKAPLSPCFLKHVYIRCGRIECIQNKNRTQKNLCYKNIPHHLLDVASPRRTFTVSQYQKLAKEALADIAKRGKIPIICGGTGLYIDAIIYDTKFPEVPPQRKLRKKLEKLSAEELFEKLKKLDPRRANNIDKNNKRRLIRAIEIAKILGKTPIIQQIQNKKSPYIFLKIGIKKTPDELKKLIAKRLKKRLDIGMIEEVKNLREQGISWRRLDNLGLEYRYASRYLRGLTSKKEMIEQLNKEIYGYAKRQMTWFKRDKNTFWIDSEKEALEIAEKFLK